MAIEKPAPWTGASGTDYVFYVFGLEPDVPKRLGNYIYAKRNAEGAWVPVYMGQGDLSACCTDPVRRRCIESKAATHVHLRLNSLEADREAELRDLLAHYANAFAPEGCHPAAETATSATEPRSRKTRASETTATKKAARKAPAKKAAAKTGAVKTSATKKSTTRKTPVNPRVKPSPKRLRPPSK